MARVFSARAGHGERRASQHRARARLLPTSRANRPPGRTRAACGGSAAAVRGAGPCNRFDGTERATRCTSAAVPPSRAPRVGCAGGSRLDCPCRSTWGAGHGYEDQMMQFLWQLMRFWRGDGRTRSGVLRAYPSTGFRNLLPSESIKCDASNRFGDACINRIPGGGLPRIPPKGPSLC